MPTNNEFNPAAAQTGDMSAEEFRRHGHQIVDWISDYFENIEKLPVLAQIEPGELTGLLYATASDSSMHAIAAAREGVELRIREEGMSGRTDLPLLRVYASEQAHSSIEKAIITLGLGQRGLRKIPTDAEFRMDATALAEAIEEDKRDGFLPFCVVATVGT